MRKVLLVSVAVFATSKPSADAELAFQSFEAKFQKQYSSPQERAQRLEVFASNLELAEKRNHANIAAGGQAVHGVTRFSDLTPEEFKSRFLSTIPAHVSMHANHATPLLSQLKKTPPSVDWRTKDAVTPVENEGQCGSTWAFSVKEAVESYAFINGKSPLLSLSAQQIVSCDKNDYGCNGGMPDSAFQYIIDAGGLESTHDYPYVSGNGTVPDCKFQKSKVKVSIAGYKVAPKGETTLKTIVTEGPPSACLSAQSWQTYSGGVITTCPGQMDHCVQIVGYDDTAKPAYWLARNQWSTEWGEQGYIRIAQGSDLCLVADLVTYPTF